MPLKESAKNVYDYYTHFSTGFLIPPYQQKKNKKKNKRQKKNKKKHKKNE
jgi:hypothetical protein